MITSCFDQGHAGRRNTSRHEMAGKMLKVCTFSRGVLKREPVRPGVMLKIVHCLLVWSNLNILFDD